MGQPPGWPVLLGPDVVAFVLPPTWAFLWTKIGSAGKLATLPSAFPVWECRMLRSPMGSAATATLFLFA